MKNKLKKSALLIVFTISAYLFLLIFPNPLFAFKYDYKNFIVYADQPIPTEIEMVLEDVKKRIEQSELYSDQFKLKIFICHDSWRFFLFTRNKNAGGLVNGLISPNVFIRDSNIKTNEIIPPNGWMLLPKERPLSYFIAHELTHSLQSEYDPFMILKVPGYIMEGYADYIGKGNSIDYEVLKKQYLNKDFVMDPANGLYNKYHLYIAHLIEKRGLDFKQIIREKPALEKVLKEIENF